MSGSGFSLESECGSKIAYDSKKAARRASGAIQAGYSRKRLDVYRCHHCHRFHLGNIGAKHRLIVCAGCGRPWRPNAHIARDGTVLAVFVADPTSCRNCQPGAA
jgi:hypothetical protein